MNKKYAVFALLCYFTLSAFSQDTIYMVNENKFVGKVLRISLTDVTYKKSDTLKSREVFLPKATVRLIAYANGSIEIISIKNIPPSQSNNSLFIRGMHDAVKYYTHPGGSIGTGITSFLTGGILGLIPAIACSATKPRFINLGLPRDALVNNKDYMLGYISTAKKMKQRKVWKGYAFGVGAAVAFLLVTKH